MTASKPWCCPRWTTPNGRCSDDDSGAGRHTCRVTSPTHMKCRCACGVETERPSSERRERRHQVSIDVSPGGRGRVVVGGVDIANMITSAIVELRGMQPTTVTLGIEAVHVVAEAQGELDDVTAGALVGLGWTSPEGDLLRRRDLQEALGGIGAVLREWDELVERVRLQHEAAVSMVMKAESDLAAALGQYAPVDAAMDMESLLMCVRGLVHRLSGLDK